VTAPIAEEAVRWTRTLPAVELNALIDAVTAGGHAVAALRAWTSHAETLRACDWAAGLVADGQGAYVAGLLEGAFLEHKRSSHTSIDVVWTGPQSKMTSSRLTIAVVAGLIGEANREIILVSYASYPPALIRDALSAAAERGVEIVLLTELPADRPGFHGVEMPMPELPCRRLHWPASARPKGASLHAKLLIVDGATALVGSANLTGNAMEQNLECGLLVRGGPVPAALRKHLTAIECIEPVGLTPR
jgi:phosphatidylserine/phosphatidylglycerophosphate/cardiolipin synthase-like enzyme